MCLILLTHSGFELHFNDTFLSPLSQWKMYNPSFSQVEIWFRFVFVVLTFMVTVRDLCNWIHLYCFCCLCLSLYVSLCCCVLQCMFAHSLRKFSMRDWGIEQKWMSILLPLLLLYNGESLSCLPLFPLCLPLHTRPWYLNSVIYLTVPFWRPNLAVKTHIYYSL